jgi:hypothetical protein
MAAIVRTLLKSEKMTADKRKSNTIPNTKVFHKGKQYPKQRKNTIEKTTDKTTTENRLRKMERKLPALAREDHAPPLDGRTPAGKAGSTENHQKPSWRKSGREDVVGTRRKGRQTPWRV